MDEKNKHDLKEAKVYKRSNYVDAYVECRNCFKVERGTAQTETVAIKNAEKGFDEIDCGDKENVSVDVDVSVDVVLDSGHSFEEKTTKNKESLVVTDLSELRKYLKIQKCPVYRGSIEGDICGECGFDVSNF